MITKIICYSVLRPVLIGHYTIASHTHTYTYKQCLQFYSTVFTVLQYSVYSTVFTVQCLQYNVYSTVFTVQCLQFYSTVFTVQCLQYSVYSFTVQCLQYSVYCIFTVKFRRICERRGDVHTSQATREVYRE